MFKAKFLVSLLLLPCLAGCAALGLKSVPWPTNVAIHDTEAVDFLRGAPAVDGTLSKSLKTKDMHADGRLVGLAVSGGGARAAAFTLGVLTELQQLQLEDGSNVSTGSISSRPIPVAAGRSPPISPTAPGRLERPTGSTSAPGPR